MYHLELRQFPHNLNRFNLGDRELWAILEPWAREKAVELGQRKWSPHQAKLAVLEGPELSLQELSLGRGWRAAKRQSEDVTERVLERAREALGAPAEVSAQTGAQVGPETSPQSRPQAPSDEGERAHLADPLAMGVELATLLGREPARLLSVWRRIAARSPGLAPSESLALAERELASLENGEKPHEPGDRDPRKAGPPGPEGGR